MPHTPSDSAPIDPATSPYGAVHEPDTGNVPPDTKDDTSENKLIETGDTTDNMMVDEDLENTDDEDKETDEDTDEDDESLKVDDDVEDEETDKKGPVPYSRFKKVVQERNEGRAELEGLSKKADAFDQIIRDPEIYAFINNKVEGKQQQQPAFDASKIDLSKMSDAEIFETTGKYAVELLSPRLARIEQAVQSMVTDNQATRETSFFKNTADYPGAKENKAAIIATANKLGCDLESAYYATLGPKLLKMGKKVGKKQGKDAFKKNPDITSRSSKSTNQKRPPKIYRNVAEAWHETKREMGIR